jgi:hypothetical protein
VENGSTQYRSPSGRPLPCPASPLPPHAPPPPSSAQQPPSAFTPPNPSPLSSCCTCSRRAPESFCVPAGDCNHHRATREPRAPKHMSLGLHSGSSFAGWVLTGATQARRAEAEPETNHGGRGRALTPAAAAVRSIHSLSGSSDASSRSSPANMPPKNATGSCHQHRAPTLPVSGWRCERRESGCTHNVGQSGQAVRPAVQRGPGVRPMMLSSGSQLPLRSN